MKICVTICPNNTINVNPGNNSLVITDYADNLQRLGRIIAALDVSNATDVEVINLRHALAEAREAFLAVLDRYTLADLVANRDALTELLERGPAGMAAAAFDDDMAVAKGVRRPTPRVVSG